MADTRSKNTGCHARHACLVAAVSLAAFAALMLLLSPAAGYETSDSRTQPVSLVGMQGWPVLAFLISPVLLAAAPLAVGPQRRPGVVTAAAILLVTAILAAAGSVGLYFTPSALALTVAAVLHT